MFFPIEGLYAEVLRRLGLVANIQCEHRITIWGPATLCAYLNALQMGFRARAIEKRSSEMWKLLGRVLSDVGVRTRAINRKLRDVEAIEVPSAQLF